MATTAGMLEPAMESLEGGVEDEDAVRGAAMAGLRTDERRVRRRQEQRASKAEKGSGVEDGAEAEEDGAGVDEERITATQRVWTTMVAASQWACQAARAEVDTEGVGEVAGGVVEEEGEAEVGAQVAATTATRRRQAERSDDCCVAVTQPGDRSQYTDAQRTL